MHPAFHCKFFFSTFPEKGNAMDFLLTSPHPDDDIIGLGDYIQHEGECWSLVHDGWRGSQTTNRGNKSTT